MKMRVVDHPTLLRLNHSSIQARRPQNLPLVKLPAQPQARYWITYHSVQERTGHQDVRLCVVLNLFSGDTAWLDVSSDEFTGIPLIDVPEQEWETAMCAGTPPQAP